MMQNLIAVNEYTSEQMQYMFLSALHHDHRDGKTVLRVIADHEVIANKYENNLRKLVTMNDTGNIYVSINDFHEKTMAPYCLNAMFFDLDGHKFESKKELEQAKQNTMDILEQAVTDGVLSRWSICNDSGRGLQLFYILDRSIKVSANTRSMVNFFHATYRDMTILLQEILDTYKEDTLVLDIDNGVRDMQRICRMPETYNLKEGARCKCVMKEFNTDDTGKFITYTLNELAIMSGYDELQKECYRRNKEEKQLRRATIATNKTDEEKDQFLYRRMKQLELIQSYRNNWEGCRQTFCFIYYNAAMQIMSQKDAIEALYRFNNNFGNGIEDKQLQNIISEGRKHGFYKISSRYIVDALGLSRNEINRSGILIGTKRQEKTEEMKDYKARRDELVVSLICSGHKYDDVVDVVNNTFVNEGKSVSLRTVKNIAKRYDCGARNGSVTNVTDVDCYNRSYKKTEDVTENEEEPFLCEESAKNVVYNGLLINKCNETNNETNNTVQIEGICFDVAIENDDMFGQKYIKFNIADKILSTDKYDYGLSFLTYLRTNIVEPQFVNIVEVFMQELYRCNDETMIHNIMHGVEYLAKHYTINPELHTAVFDLESLTRSSLYSAATLLNSSTTSSCILTCWI